MRRNGMLMAMAAGSLALMAGGAAAASAEAYRERAEHPVATLDYGRPRYRSGGGRPAKKWFKGSRWAKRAHRRGGNPSAQRRMVA